jgi:hypothetical protein
MDSNTIECETNLRDASTPLDFPTFPTISELFLDSLLVAIDTIRYECRMYSSPDATTTNQETTMKTNKKAAGWIVRNENDEYLRVDGDRSMYSQNARVFATVEDAREAMGNDDQMIAVGSGR